MSYTRGENYIWRDGERVHLWIGDGADNWAECGWNEGRPHTDPAGVAVAQEVMDEYVIMRFAELVQTDHVAEVVDRAMARHSGNGGCVALRELAGALKRVS